MFLIVILFLGNSPIYTILYGPEMFENFGKIKGQKSLKGGTKIRILF